ncbi:MAG: hypothetical protein ABIA76_01750 [Candidatus Diapherotrites archaeon]
MISEEWTSGAGFFLERKSTDAKRKAILLSRIEKSIFSVEIESVPVRELVLFKYFDIV